MSQRCDALSDRPEPIKPQGINRQTPQSGQDLNAVELPVAVSVFSQRHVSHPVPAVLDRPALTDGSEQGLGSRPQTRDLVAGLVLWIVLTDAMAAHGDDRRAARPLLHHPLRRRHRPEALGDVSAPFHLLVTGLPGCTTTAGEPITDQLKPFAAPVFDGDQEVGVAPGEVEKKGRFACNASA